MSFVPLLPDAIASHLQGSLVVVIPIYNEAAQIETFVHEWQTCLASVSESYQMILIDDESRDDTLLRLRQLEEKDPFRLVVVTKPNSGHGRTCRLGYSAAVLAPSVEWVLQIDSDGQCDPSYFPEFWAARASADCIFGRRVTRDDGVLRTATSMICRWMTTLLCGRDLVDPNVPYRLIRKTCLEKALKRIPASFDIHNVALTSLLKQQPETRWHYVPIRFRERQGGNNSINLLNVIHLGVSMLFDFAKLPRS